MFKYAAVLLISIISFDAAFSTDANAGVLDAMQSALSSDNIKKSDEEICGSSHPFDFAMQKICRQTAQAGRHKFISLFMANKENVALAIALNGCIERHTKRDITDWTLAGVCAETQEEGYRELNN